MLTLLAKRFGTVAIGYLDLHSCKFDQDSYLKIIDWDISHLQDLRWDLVDDILQDTTNTIVTK